MSATPHIDLTYPFEPDPEGLWTMPFSRAERAALARAFATDRELRGELEHYLRRLNRRLSHAFALAFARQLVADPDSRPAGAMPAALNETIAVAVDHGANLDLPASWGQP